MRVHLCNDAINNVLSLLRHELQTAVDWGVIHEMPCTIRQIKRRHRDATPVLPSEYYNFDEYRLLIDAARADSLRTEVVVLLGGDAGLRLGEIRALRERCLDFKQRLITVCEQVTTWKRKDWFDLPKGGKARVLKMTPRLEAALSRWCSIMRGESARGVVVPIGDRLAASTFVLGSYARGRPYSDSSIGGWLKQAQDKAGVKGSGSAHILRHTFCSHLAMRGCSPSQIMELAGHEDFRTTKRYLHLCPKVRDEGIDLLDAAD